MGAEPRVCYSRHTRLQYLRTSRAEFFQQCGECKEDCPKHADIPALMRSHMYAVQYGNNGMARETLASVAAGRGLDACDGCESCAVACRNSVQVGRKIAHLKALARNNVLSC